LNSRHRFLAIAAFAVLLYWGIAWSAEDLPTQLSDQAYWKLITELSEAGGSFPSDNFVSNERLFQHVLSDLTRDRKPGGGYLGVGPDQNFTYIVALKPKIAFIVDIRRQNMIEHLMYKALFELSANRVEFLSRLFSRIPPPELTKDASVTALFDAFGGVPPDPELYIRNLKDIRDKLIGEHGFELSIEDQVGLEYIYRAFYNGGPRLTYSRTNPMGIMPAYEDLMMETDEEGRHRSYLATEQNFNGMRELEIKNLLVPVVGDFAGPLALRSVGAYLKAHNATVKAFYTSNVEQYLFQSDENWRKFYTNVGHLPLDSTSVFIRAVIRTISGELSPSPTIRPGFSRIENALYPIVTLLEAFKADRILIYSDILQ
jgi:hypothetical protein